MKRIRRIKLDSLQKEMSFLPKKQLSIFVGGGDNPYRINGGTIQNTDIGVVWMGDDGRSCTFYGVSFDIGGLCYANAAYQLSGTIHIGSEWAENGFGVYDFAHEFGHYLQQEEYGFLGYVTDVIIPSVTSASSPNHSEIPCEKDATKRGKDYLDKNLK